MYNHYRRKEPQTVTGKWLAVLAVARVPLRHLRLLHGAVQPGELVLPPCVVLACCVRIMKQPGC